MNKVLRIALHKFKVVHLFNKREIWAYLTPMEFLLCSNIGIKFVNWEFELQDSLRCIKKGRSFKRRRVVVFSPTVQLLTGIRHYD